MDFMNRGGRPVQQNTQTQTNSPEGPPTQFKAPVQKSSNTSNSTDKSKWGRIGGVLFVGMVTVVLVGVLFLTIFAKDAGSRENGFVKSNQFQAVFLNGGQVYFGKIQDLNTKYIKLDNIYYLRVNQQVQPDQQNNAAANDISLVKLGCELHGPDDSMVINREQVIFWENLKDDGQVAKAVGEYVKANPNGQNCEEQNKQGGTPATNNGTPATPNTGTAPKPTPPATTPAPAAPPRR